jgi:protein SCO1/2
VTLAGLVQAIGSQSLRPGSDFITVAFGIDPKEGPRDAAENLSRLPNQAIHGLTGSAQNIAAVTAEVGYRYAWDPQLEQYDHVAAIAVLAPDGQLTRWLYGVAPEPADLKLALVEAGQGKTGGWTDQLILLCYHYDPVTGRYSNVIWTTLRLLAGGAILALTAFIGRAIYRERRSAQGGQP